MFVSIMFTITYIYGYRGLRLYRGLVVDICVYIYTSTTFRTGIPGIYVYIYMYSMHSTIDSAIYANIKPRPLMGGISPSADLPLDHI